LERKHQREDECKCSEFGDAEHPTTSPEGATAQKLQIVVPTAGVPDINLPSLASVESITHIHEVQYPAGIKRPDAELNVNNEGGKFRYLQYGILYMTFSAYLSSRYDREFLLQFMPICKQKPHTRYPLAVLSIDPDSRPPSFEPRKKPAPSIMPTPGIIKPTSGTTPPSESKPSYRRGKRSKQSKMAKMSSLAMPQAFDVAGLPNDLDVAASTAATDPGT
jgi:hypothetical protein